MNITKTKINKERVNHYLTLKAQADNEIKKIGKMTPKTKEEFTLIETILTPEETNYIISIIQSLVGTTSFVYSRIDKNKK